MTRPGKLRSGKLLLCASLIALILAPSNVYAAGGTVTLNGATSGTVVVQVPAVAGSTTFQLPGNNGTSGFFLTTDGTGVTSWVGTDSVLTTPLSTIIAAA